MLRKAAFYPIIIFLTGIVFMLLRETGSSTCGPEKRFIPLPSLHGLGIDLWLEQLFFLNGIGNLKRQKYIGEIGTVSFVPLALFWGERYGLLGICMALIIVHPPVAVSNPLESLGSFTRFSKLGIPRQG